MVKVAICGIFPNHYVLMSPTKCAHIDKDPAASDCYKQWKGLI